MKDPGGIAVFLDAMNTKYRAGMTAEFLDPRRQRHASPSGRSGSSRSPTTTSPAARPAGRSRAVSRATSGLRWPPSALTLVQNLWGLTRRRALDFGRVTTAGC